MSATLYFNGEILTMVGDSADSVKYVEAVVEKDGKIAFAGELAKAKRIYPRFTAVDLHGSCMMPGHIDPHLHPSMASLILKMHFITPFKWDLPSGTYEGVQTAEGYQSRLKDLIRDNYEEFHKTPENFLITWGYHQAFHGEMSRKVIDDLMKESKEVSIVVWHRSFHEVYLNSLALANLEYDDLEALQENEQVKWDEGHFYEMGLDALMSTTSFGKLLMPMMKSGYKELVAVINQNGVTTVGDLEFPLIDMEKEQEYSNTFLKSEDAFFSSYCVPSARNYGRLAGGDNEKALQLIQETSETMSNDQLFVYKDHIKCLHDGAFYSQLMQMKEPYLDGHEGEWITPPDELAKVMEFYWKNGFQIHVHTNGDLGMESLLDIVENLEKTHGRNPHKATVEHAGYFTEDQAERIAKLDMMVSAAPYYFYTLADEYVETLGEERSYAIAPMKWLFERGVTTAFHSDFTMAPSQPMLLAWSAINRITANHKTHRLDLCCSAYEGMLAITKNAATILGTEDIMGTIEEGKLANFTILKHNPLKVFPPLIRSITIMGSVYKGKLNKVNV